MTNRELRPWDMELRELIDQVADEIQRASTAMVKLDGKEQRRNQAQRIRKELVRLRLTLIEMCRGCAKYRTLAP